MEKKKFMVDTNVIICLANYDCFKNAYYVSTKEGISLEKAQCIEKLYNKINDNKVDVAVPQWVVVELKQGIKHHNGFVYDYFKKSNISEIRFGEVEFRTIVDLAEMYATKKSISTNEFAFANDNLGNGHNDALIMASATVSGRKIITFDSHFLKKRYTIKDINKMYYNENKNYNLYLQKNTNYHQVEPCNIVFALREIENVNQDESVNE